MEEFEVARRPQAPMRVGCRQTRERRVGAATAQAGRTEGNSVGWHTARRAAGATAIRREVCARCDSQQDCPNAPGWAAREEWLAICFGGTCGCEARSCAFTEAHRGWWSGCEGAEVRLIARGAAKTCCEPFLASRR